MTIDWWTLGFQAVNVLILVWLLGRFLWKPVAAVIAERQSQIADTIKAADAKRAEAEAALRANAATRANFEKERQDILAAARQSADSEREALLAAGRTEATAARSAAEAALAAEQAAAQAAWQERASRLAVEVARRLLQRLDQPSVRAAFLADLCTTIGAMPVGERDALVDHAHPLALVSAATLSPAEAEVARTQLAAALGQPTEVTFSADPALVAGLELHGRHTVIGNSWRRDLDRILGELTHG